MDLPRRLQWCRATDLYPHESGALDDFVALDGQTQVGVMKLMDDAPAGPEWMWSMWVLHPGTAFPRVTKGRCERRGEAARALGACYAAFRAHHRLDGGG